MKTLKLMLLLFFSVSLSTATAQISKDAYKKRAEMMNLNKKMQEDKVSKESRKQAKQLTKEGWKVAPGALSLEKQLERAALFQNSFEDDYVTPKYVSGDATSTAENYDAGKMQALEMARINLVTSIEGSITRIVENNTHNKQLGAGDAASVIGTLGKVKSHITQKIGQTIPVIEVYKELKNGNVAVRVMTFYSMDNARKIAKEAIRKQMEEEGNKVLGDDLDKYVD